MTPETLSAMAGALLSLLLNYVPGLRARFDSLTADGQRVAMVVLLAVVAAGLTLWTCTDPEAVSGDPGAVGGGARCLGAGTWRQAVQSFVFAAMANQATDRLSPKPRGPA